VSLWHLGSILLAVYYSASFFMDMMFYWLLQLMDVSLSSLFQMSSIITKIGRSFQDSQFISQVLNVAKSFLSQVPVQ
jgi:hypothetical protein